MSCAVDPRDPRAQAEDRPARPSGFSALGPDDPDPRAQYREFYDFQPIDSTEDDVDVDFLLEYIEVVAEDCENRGIHDRDGDELDQVEDDFDIESELVDLERAGLLDDPDREEAPTGADDRGDQEPRHGVEETRDVESYHSGAANAPGSRGCPPTPGSVVVKFLTGKQLRESFYIKLFKVADPAQELTIPAMLEAVATTRANEATVLTKQAREAAATRCLNDVACMRGIAGFITTTKDKPTRSRLQDLDDRGLARLVELADLLSGHAEEPAEVVEVLAVIKPEILAAIDILAPRDDAPRGVGEPDQGGRAA
jgi:hypothetical protein